jgi:hypothetical protein
MHFFHGVKKELKKVIFTILLSLSSQSFAYQFTDGSRFAFADLLVWQLREGAADNWAQNIDPIGTDRAAKIIDVPFQWNAGFRVGVGYNSPELWDAVVYYTRYQVTSSAQASGNIYSAFLGNFFFNNTTGGAITTSPYYQQGSIQWNFQFNTLDLELGRKFNIDNILQLRPFVGLKTALIQQNIQTNWQNPINNTTFTAATENVKQHYWGVGPAVGVSSTWPFYKTAQQSFNLFGNVSAALMWGHWNFSELYSNNAQYTDSIVVSDVNGASTMARGMLGLEWVKEFSKASVNVRVSYEAQVWFDQLQFYLSNGGRLNNLMSLQGGVLDFGINF